MFPQYKQSTKINVTEKTCVCGHVYPVAYYIVPLGMKRSICHFTKVTDTPFHIQVDEYQNVFIRLNESRVQTTEYKDECYRKNVHFYVSVVILKPKACYIVHLNMKGSFSQFTKWQIDPFVSKSKNIKICLLH